MSDNTENNQTNGTKDSQESKASGAEATSELENLRALAEKYKNDYLYLRAEFDNYKKHAIKERSEMIKYGSERLVVELLSILDNFERAIDTKISQENYLTYSKGVELTAQELKSLLSRFGITELGQVGDPFDPMIHEALTSEESDLVQDGHVLRLFRKAYKLHDKLVRPAQVVVAKQSKANPQ